MYFVKWTHQQYNDVAILNAQTSSRIPFAFYYTSITDWVLSQSEAVQFRTRSWFVTEFYSLHKTRTEDGQTDSVYKWAARQPQPVISWKVLLQLLLGNWELHFCYWPLCSRVCAGFQWHNTLKKKTWMLLFIPSLAEWNDSLNAEVLLIVAPFLPYNPPLHYPQPHSGRKPIGILCLSEGLSTV